MKRTLKKILSMGLAFVMLMCTCLSTTAFAASENAVATLTADESTVITPRDTALGTVIFSLYRKNRKIGYRTKNKKEQQK